MNQCSMCDEIYNNRKPGALYSYLKDVYKENNLESRILYEDNQFIIIPSLGPVSECHLLLVPKKHVCSFAVLDSDMLNLSEIMIQRVSRIVRDKYGNCIAFEHGTLNDEMVSSASCNHAHMHIVFCPQSLMPSFKRDGVQMHIINKLCDLKKLAKSEKPYFYYRENNGQGFMAEDTVQKSQYMRFLAADILGNSEYRDWKKNLGISVISKTISTIGLDLRHLCD